MVSIDQQALDALHAEVESAMEAWGIRAGDWEVAGAALGARGGLLRPIITVTSGEAAGSWILRRQAPDLTLDDVRFRHSFMGTLTGAGLPVPALLSRPDGHTWAIVDNAICELQAYIPGSAYSSAGPEASQRIQTAAATLGALHQASAEFAWQPYRWPANRSAPDIAQAYLELVRDAAHSAALPPMVRAGLARAVDACDARVAAASERLISRQPGPPELHIHGDYQPHNLGFRGPAVAAIYDFDAARWEQRIYELAYALLFFTGLRWDADTSVTLPLVDDGLDTLAAHSFLASYGREAPPAEDEPESLADALTLVFPIALANGAAEDLVFAADFDGELDEEDALARLEWADRFWLWLDRYGDMLGQAWAQA